MLQSGKLHMLRQAERQLWTSVLATLRLAIIRGELQPHTHLFETELAEMLGVSRGPVRDALVRLEYEGLVINVPYRGRFVAEITAKSVNEIYRLRRLLECCAAEEAVHHITDEQISQLRLLSAEMTQSLEEDEYEKFADLDIEFHRRFITVADYPRLLQTWETLMGITHSFIVIAANGYPLNTEVIAAGHDAIIASAERRDVGALTEAISRYLDEGERRVLAMMRRQPFAQ